MLYKFGMIVYIWDSFYWYMDATNEDLIFAMCYVFCGFLLNTYMEEDEHRYEWFSELQIDETDILKHLWDYGEKIKWRLYQPSIDRYLHQHHSTIPWELFLDFYSDWNQPYTTQSLVNAWKKYNRIG